MEAATVTVPRELDSLMANAMEHLSDFVFVSMANVTLMRRDSYLAYVKSGLKQDTFAALHRMDLLTLCTEKS